MRILCLDGGGMRGLALVQMLKEMERRTGRRVRDMFDLVAGTSTGGMIAAALIIRGFSLDACNDVYKKLGGLLAGTCMMTGAPPKVLKRLKLMSQVQGSRLLREKSV